MSNATFVYVSYIATTPEKLWDALTSGAFTRRYWYDRRIESSWQPGEPVRFYDGASDTVTDEGEVLAFDPPRELAYTFRNNDEEPGAASRVHFTLEVHDDLVKLMLVHDQLPDQETADGFREGWAPILSSLKTFLETGYPLAELRALKERLRGE